MNHGVLNMSFTTEFSANENIIMHKTTIQNLT